jgi:hypothetical protein
MGRFPPKVKRRDSYSSTEVIGLAYRGVDDINTSESNIPCESPLALGRPKTADIHGQQLEQTSC